MKVCACRQYRRNCAESHVAGNHCSCTFYRNWHACRPHPNPWCQTGILSSDSSREISAVNSFHRRRGRHAVITVTLMIASKTTLRGINHYYLRCWQKTWRDLIFIGKMTDFYFQRPAAAWNFAILCYGGLSGGDAALKRLVVTFKSCRMIVQGHLMSTVKLNIQRDNLISHSKL